MSRRGNCHDNAVAESFFQLLKRERIKRKIYTTREDARSDVFDYIEMFYNVKRRHGFNNQLSPVEFEKRYARSLQGVKRIRGDSICGLSSTRKIGANSPVESHMLHHHRELSDLTNSFIRKVDTPRIQRRTVIA